MENRSLVVKRLARLALSLFSGAEGAEVLGSLGADVVEQLKINSKLTCKHREASC